METNIKEKVNFEDDRDDGYNFRNIKETLKIIKYNFSRFYCESDISHEELITTKKEIDLINKQVNNLEKRYSEWDEITTIFLMIEMCDKLRIDHNLRYKKPTSR